MLNPTVNHASKLRWHAIGVTEPVLKVGDRIRIARESKGLDQKPVARAAGITVSALSQIENSITKQPTPETLFKIADALDVEARYLVFGHHDPVAPSLSSIRPSDTARLRLRRIAQP